MVYRVVGQSVVRRDFYEKVTGEARFSIDTMLAGSLYAAIVRSDRAHAQIDEIDTTVALAIPGVVSVITSSDISVLFDRFGHIVPDHFILAPGKVRYYGEPVAIVVAESPEGAADAVAAVEVHYLELPCVMSASEALADSAELVHDEVYSSSGDKSFEYLTGPTSEASGTPNSNVAHEVLLEWGDLDQAFRLSDKVIETCVVYPMLYPYAMEPYNSVAYYHEGQLDVISSAQHPYMVRDDLCRIFQLPLSRVRVSVPYVGGGYGSKSYTKVEPLAAVASWATGRPVKLSLSVEESIHTTRSDSAEITVRTALSQDGIILGRDIDIVMDSGAYADNSPLVVAKCVNRAVGPYRVPAARVRGRSVYTNTVPASSYRGFGAPQASFAGESNLDEAAEALGIGGDEIRRRNLVRFGEEILPGKRGVDADLIADLDLVTSSLERGRPVDVPHYGIGFACSASDAGAYPISTANVRVATDGSATVLTGSTEMGQGSRSALAQIAAEEMGLPLSSVQVVQSDTGVTAYERTTGASRTTTLVGLAVQRACADARSKLELMATEVVGCTKDELSAVLGGFIYKDRHYTYGSVIMDWFGGSAGEVVGIGIVRREGETAKLPPFWEIGMCGVGVIVDPETGRITVDQLVTVGDVGFAINKRAVEAQDLGAATQGLGGALYEEILYDGPQIVNPNVVDYRVPRVGDLPRRIDTIIAERRDGVGPYGAKGSGEGSLNPIGAAVAAAIWNATGKRVRALPVTPERMWSLLHDDTVS